MVKYWCNWNFVLQIVKFLIIIWKFILNFLGGIDDAILVRLKNLSLIIAYFYIFDTISIEFIKGYIENLCENFNEDYLEILVLLI